MTVAVCVGDVQRVRRCLWSTATLTPSLDVTRHFFQSLCGGLSAWPHWGSWTGLLGADLELSAEPAAACWAVGGVDFCGFTFLVLFSVAGAKPHGLMARAKPHGLVGIKTGKTAKRKAMDTLNQGTWTLDT